MYTEASARQIAERAERKSLSRSRSVSCERSSDNSYSSFWESSDCDDIVSLSGFSSQSDSELVSPESSTTQEKESTESSDEEIPAQVRSRKDYHSDSENSDEPSNPTQRRGSARSRRGTARGRGRGTRGKTQGSTRSRGSTGGRGGRGGQKGGGRKRGQRTCSELKYPHSVPEEAVSIEKKQ